jgi:exopolyphosphatase/guanosine-5'-triphosphate,3'-diphosphate pyrophosphatase
MTVEETAAIPSLDPRRAPVILGGALVAEAVMDTLGVDQATISEHDTLDGVAMESLALP